MRTLEVLRADVARHLETLWSVEGATQPLVPRAVTEGARRNVEHRIERLERRFVAAQKRRSESALNDIATARGGLFPNGKRQERALNPIPILTRHGSVVLDEMLAAARVHARELVSDARASGDRADASRTASISR